MMRARAGAGGPIFKFTVADGTIKIKRRNPRSQGPKSKVQSPLSQPILKSKHNLEQADVGRWTLDIGQGGFDICILPRNYEHQVRFMDSSHG